MHTYSAQLFTQPIVQRPTEIVDPAHIVPFYDPEIGLIQESRAARQASEGLRIWQRVYAARQ